MSGWSPATVTLPSAPGVFAVMAGSVEYVSETSVSAGIGPAAASAVNAMSTATVLGVAGAAKGISTVIVVAELVPEPTVTPVTVPVLKPAPWLVLLGVAVRVYVSAGTMTALPVQPPDFSTGWAVAEYTEPLTEPLIEISTVAVLPSGADDASDAAGFSV